MRGVAAFHDNVGFEILFQRIVETTREGVLVLDGQRCCTFVNRRMEEMLGYAPGELLGKPVSHFIDASPDSLARETIDRGQRLGDDGELEVRRKDGSKVWVMLSSTPLPADSSGSARVLWTVRDIDDRKKAEARFRGLLDAAPDAMVIAANDGRIILVNTQVERLFGYERHELVGEPIEKLIPERFRAKSAEGREKFFAAPAIPPMGAGRELFGLRKNGTEFPAEISLSPMSVEEVPLVIAAIRDISERKAMQARVTLADRMASVGTLAAGVAHEINNPLAYVMANLDMIGEEVRGIAGANPSGEMRELEEMIGAARQGAERVRKIVRGLRTFSRTDEEKRVPLDVQAVLEMSINLAYNEIKHRARLVKDYRETLRVVADETRLGQVFINLLVNAAQAIPEGHADRNEIRLITGMASGSRVMVEVKDTGRGIPPDAMGRIFDPFFTTKSIGQGTGLGLSICHNIVAGLGGEIAVESDPGRGSTFRVLLPAMAPGAEMIVADSKRPSNGAAAPPGRPGSVLVVDDDAAVGKSLRRVLDREHEVTVVTSGSEALSLLLSDRHFDVILCDLMMPEMTGMELHETLSQRKPEIVDRIVFITGGAFTPAARAFLDEVANQRLEKPFVPQNLRGLVRSLVR